MESSVWRSTRRSEKGNVASRFRDFVSNRNSINTYQGEEDTAVYDMMIDLQEQLSNQHRWLLASARTFLPDAIAERIWAGTLPDEVIVSKSEGAVVFSDASGFTALTERLTCFSNGAELLSKCLNKFFTPLIDTLTAYRGDVVKFSGDALTILFAAVEDDNEPCTRSACGSPCCEHDPLELACLRASACCVEIHKRLHNFDTGEGDVRLTLHIGVGAGKVTILQVGGDQGRYEYVLAGEPLEQIAVAEPLAGSGETVLSPQCWNLVSKFMVEGPTIAENPEYHRLLGLDDTRHTYPTVKQAARQTRKASGFNLYTADTVDLDETIYLTRFIPRSVLKQLCAGSLRGMDEMRTVSIIFVQIAGVDVSTDEGAQRSQALMSGMQAVAYNHEGSLNKFLVDDKGLLFLFVFGLPPFVHIDDPVRATRCTLDMTNFLRKMHLTGRIGITTGRVYCGVVGSDTRREYTVMGDTVNLSARLMANAEPNTVLIDDTTYRRCQDQFSFLTIGPIKVKGKEQKIPCYRPLHRNRNARSTVAAEDDGGLVFRSLSSPSQRKISLPWTPKTQAFGGDSLLTTMRWEGMAETMETGRRIILQGGGAMLIHGPSGCGKDEICEELIKYCADEEHMVPIFGNMKMLTGDEYAVFYDIIVSLLVLLYGDGMKMVSTSERIKEETITALAQKGALTNNELLVLQDVVPASKSSYPGSANNLRSSIHRSARESHYSMNTSDQTGDTTAEARALAKRLLNKFLDQESAVITLRAHQGTSLSTYDTSAFWVLAQDLARMANVRQRKHRLLVLVLCRTGVWKQMTNPSAKSMNDVRSLGLQVDWNTSKSGLSTAIPNGGGLSTRTANDMTRSPNGEAEKNLYIQENLIGPLSDEEAHIYMGLLLEVGESDRPSDCVPQRLRKWLHSIALNNPRNIREVIQQLREEGKLVVENGRAIIKTDLDSVDVADWVHAGMVGGIISQVEIMNADAQRIIKMAAVFDGPISALDIAAANRTYRPATDLLAFHDSAKLLMSCEWLVGVGFLDRFECPPGSAPEDGQSWRLPRWTIPSLLTRKVVSATMLQSQKIQIKRAVLMQRALNIELPIRMQAKIRMRAELFGDVDRTEVRTRRRRKVTNSSTWKKERSLRPCTDTATDGLPASCCACPHGGDTSAVNTEMRMNDLLSLMCLAKDHDRVAQLLATGAPVALKEGCVGPIQCACAAGDLDAVKMLLQARADAEECLPECGNCLDLAVQYGNMSVAKYLAEQAGLVPSFLSQLNGNALNRMESSVSQRSSTRDRGLKRVVSNRSSGNATTGASSTKEELTSRVFGLTLSSVEHRNADVLTEELNYKRSQTLLFLQDSMSLLDEERELERHRSARPNRNHAPLVQAETKMRRLAREYMASDIRVLMLVLCISMAILGPDVWTIGGGSQRSLDVLLSTSMFYLLLDIVCRFIFDAEYRKSLQLGLELFGALAITFEISWIFGVDRDDDPMRPDTPLDGRGGAYNVPFALFARAADLLVRAGRYSGEVAHLINTIFVCCLGRSSLGDKDFGGIEQLRKQLLKTISLHVGTYAILLAVLLPCLNFIHVPNEDMSMRAWTEILTEAMPNGNASSLSAQRSLSAFESFYSNLFYGPFKVCSGRRVRDDFECDKGGTIWASDVSSEDLRFSSPQVAASRLDIHSSALSLSFDFSAARRIEAWMNLGMLATVTVMMMLTTLFISRSISDLVLRPLQRMLSSAKEVAKPIFGDASAFGDDNDDHFDDENDDGVLVLEKIVQKLGKIANIAANIANVEVGTLEGLVGEERAVMQMIGAKDSASGLHRGSTSGLSECMLNLDVDLSPGKRMQTRLLQIGTSWEDLDSWEFDVGTVGMPILIGVAGWILLLNTITYTEVELEGDATGVFLKTLAGNYRATNYFHNWMHAVDVQHTMWRMIRLSEAHNFLTGHNQLAMLVAALGHDVGHFSVNNAFLVDTGHELTVRYNDCSPLENMHCAKLFEIITNVAGANIFKPLARTDFFETRKTIIEMVMHTDMAHHFEMVKEMQMLYQMNSDASPFELMILFRERDTKMKLMNLIIHSADISNPCKPWKITQAWALRCLEEFFFQGDLEKQLGIPVQMLNDRTKVCTPFSQIGFVEFMIAPLEAAKTSLFPKLHETTTFLEHNLWQWSRLWIEEKAPPEDEREKVVARIQKTAQLLSAARQAWQNHAQHEKNVDDVEVGSIAGTQRP